MENLFIKSQKGKLLNLEVSRTGRTNKTRDKKRSALEPGKRLSKSGKIYYEKRRNRSDLSGEKI